MKLSIELDLSSEKKGGLTITFDFYQEDINQLMKAIACGHSIQLTA